MDVYPDALLLTDALERHDVTDLTELETDALVNPYTLLSDVQRNANDVRQAVADVLLDRLHHDRPVSGQYGSVQRTTRRNRSLKDDGEVLAVLKAAGIDRFGAQLTATGRRPVAVLPSRILLDETVVRQRGEDFVLFAALAPETREVVHLSVYPSKSYYRNRAQILELRVVPMMCVGFRRDFPSTTCSVRKRAN